MSSKVDPGTWLGRFCSFFSTKSPVLNVVSLLLVCALVGTWTIVYPGSVGDHPALTSTVWLVVQFWIVGLLVIVCRGRVGGLASKLSGLLAGSQPGPCRTKTTRAGKGSWFTFVCSEMQGWRNAMEDAIVTKPALDAPFEEYSVFAVFDGHGGADASAHAAQIIVDRVSRRLALDSDSEVALALKQSLLDVEEDLRKHNTPLGIDLNVMSSHPVAAVSRGRFDLQGCTATVALLSRSSVTVCNVGDSRIFKCRNGQCVPLTRDHKPESPRERRRIEAAGGTVQCFGPCYRVDGHLNLSRALADFRYKDVSMAHEDQKICPVGDVVTAEIDDSDEFLVVACDGLFELMTWNSVCEYVRQRIKTKPLDAIAEGLLDECCTPDIYSTNGRGTDNESVIIVKLHDT